MPAHTLANPNAFRSPGEAEASTDIRLIGVTRSYGRDQEIFGQSDRADSVYKVVSGAVRSYCVLADGRRQILAFHLPGDVFGLELGAEHDTGAEAIGETILIVARRSGVIDDPDQGARLWRHAWREMSRGQAHMLTLGRRTAMERVATFLTELAERVGARLELELAMSRQDIADYLGLTIETVSRTLTQLQVKGLIKLVGCRHVSLAQPAALLQLSQ